MFIFAKNLELVAVVENALYSIRWSPDEGHSLDEMADKLTDVEYLTNYFEKNRDKLSYFGVSIAKAVSNTHYQANVMIQAIFSMAENSRQGLLPDLEDIFEPLHKDGSYDHPRFYTDFKVRGKRGEAPWVRLYAVRCDENLYVISGFGIKLVKRMQDDPELMKELKKLEKATEYLKEVKLL